MPKLKKKIISIWRKGTGKDNDERDSPIASTQPPILVPRDLNTATKSTITAPQALPGIRPSQQPLLGKAQQVKAVPITKSESKPTTKGTATTASPSTPKPKLPDELLSFARTSTLTPREEVQAMIQDYGRGNIGQALAWAVENNRSEDLTILLEHGVRSSTPGTFGVSFTYASNSGNIALLSRLMDVFRRSSNLGTLIRCQGLMTLIARNVDINDLTPLCSGLYIQQQYMLMEKAVEWDLCPLMKALLIVGTDPNRCLDGRSILPLVVRNGNVELFNALTSDIATDVNAAGLIDPYAYPRALWPSLQVASRFGNRTMLVLLLGCVDININATAYMGHTALHTAAQWDHPQIVKLLLDNGADPALENRSAHTAMKVARESESLDSYNVLRCSAGMQPTTVIVGKRDERYSQASRHALWPDLTVKDRRTGIKYQLTPSDPAYWN